MADLLTVLDPPATVPEESSSADFDWLSDDSVVIPEQPRTAIYRNRFGAVVVRQESRSFDDEDMFVFFAGPLELRMAIAALQRQLKG